MPESVDALVIIAGRVDQASSLSQACNNREVAGIQILILVNQEVFEWVIELQISMLFEGTLELVDELGAQGIPINTTMLAPRTNKGCISCQWIRLRLVRP